MVSTAALDAHLVELSGTVRVLDLRTEATLDALGLDDQVNTSRAPHVWATCQELGDRLHLWYGDRLHGVVYRSRTTPESSYNLAFFGHAPLTRRSLGRLRGQRDLLVACVLGDRFTVEGWTP